MSQYTGLYVQKTTSGTIFSVQVKDTAGHCIPLEPSVYLQRDIKPPLESLPDEANYKKNTMKQTPGTIPGPAITDALNRKLPLIGPLKAGYQPNNGGPAHIVEAELYGANNKVEFVFMFDDKPGRPVFQKTDLSIVTLLQAQPALNLENAFWAYEDRTTNPALIYFFNIAKIGSQLTRTPAGQLPRQLVYAQLGK